MNSLRRINQDSRSGTKRGKTMNATKFTLTSTILAAAMGLAMGLGAAPALADPPDSEGCHPSEHKPCGGGGDSDATIYDVFLEFLQVSSPLNEVELCRGNTDTLANSELIVNFDVGCSVSITTDVSGESKVDMYLLRLEAKTKGSGDTEVVFVFSDMAFVTSGSNLWRTDRLMVVVDDKDVDGVLILTLFDSFDEGEILTKGHQPDKGTETDGGVVIGPLTYCPRPTVGDLCKGLLAGLP